ncbi:hypothetical protein AYI70_g2205 [Smittium culicis]|uniref:Uncharacterized protein n=1 Tax=Smittium culicis TaxID=133412 RepID=A0A1R1Y9C5_9FUNG|nr:hypothetical protein AYI70_g2205 [Smittium culicis]
MFEASDGRLVLDECANSAHNYSKTLRIWKENFLKEFEKISEYKPVNDYLLKKTTKKRSKAQQPSSFDKSEISVGIKYDETFKNLWEYYFTYCQAGFETRTLCLTQMVITRTSNPALIP